jgi:hypothetical protein
MYFALLNIPWSLSVYKQRVVSSPISRITTTATQEMSAEQGGQPEQRLEFCPYFKPVAATRLP